MKKLLTFLFVSILYSTCAMAQLQDRIWIFGRALSGSTNATLYFGNPSNPVIPLPCGQPNQITNTSGFEEWGVVTNPTSGNLIFYTDGMNVFDNLNNLVDLDTTMPGFESLGGNWSSSQPVAVCPITRGDTMYYNRYFIFSNPTGAIGTTVGIGPITYRIFDVSTNSFGSIHNLPGPYGSTSVSEGMVIVPSDSDPNTLWLITSLFPASGFERKYVIYKIHKAVISYQGACDMGPIKTIIPGSYGAGPVITIRYSKANTNYGITNLAATVQYNSGVFVSEFDNINGQFLTNTVRICNTNLSYSPALDDLTFSPSGRFIYFSANNSASNQLYQIDLQDSILTKVLIKSYPNPYTGGLSMAPDGFIYHIYNSGYNSSACKVGRILQPDVKFVPGVTVYTQFYEENFKSYNNVFATNFCSFLIMPNIVTGISNVNNSTNSVNIFPNPANENITVNIHSQVKDGEISIFNIQGQMMLKKNVVSQEKTEIDISGIADGVYVLKISAYEGSVMKKLIIRR